MSKMPEPAAIYKPEYGICWTSSGMAVEAVDGIQFITTTQAEAYADARVREVLEETILTLSGLCTESLKARVPEAEDEHGWNQGCLERSLALTDAMLKIRALIPPQQ